MIRKWPADCVSSTGAAAGSVVRGVVPNNEGLRLRLLQNQPLGREGPLQGHFIILDTGTSKHSSTLGPLLHKETDAGEVLAVLRRRSRACVSVVNTNILATELMSEPEASDDAAGQELDRLQGAWRAVAVEVDGWPVPPHLFRDARLVIAGSRFTLHNPLPDAEQNEAGSFTLGPGKTPRELHVTLEGGRVVREIYELSGDTLRVCYPVGGGGPPAEFRTGSGSGLSLVTYRRERA
jgi:uncharacterized protein (TIGR03067 family)